MWFVWGWRENREAAGQRAGVAQVLVLHPRRFERYERQANRIAIRGREIVAAADGCDEMHDDNRVKPAIYSITRHPRLAVRHHQRGWRAVSPSEVRRSSVSERAEQNGSAAETHRESRCI